MSWQYFKTSTQQFLFVIACLIIGGVAGYYLLPASNTPPAPSSCRPFYDGNGNELPDTAVRLLVMNQYVHLDRPQEDTLAYYFDWYYHDSVVVPVKPIVFDTLPGFPRQDTIEPKK